MRLNFISNSPCWYSLEGNRLVGLCQDGLRTCGLLPRDEAPKKFKLFLVVKNPKKSSFKKIVFVRKAGGLYHVFLDESRWMVLASNAAAWVRDNLACLCGDCPLMFSVWVRVEELKE